MAPKRLRSQTEWRQKMVEDQLLAKLKRVLAHIPFVEDLLAAYYAVLDRRTSTGVRATLLVALAYFVLPFDLVPDFILGLGYADDAAILYATLRAVSSAIREPHREAARRWLEKARRESMSV